MTDLTYLTSGLFTTFFPETKIGEDAWRVIAAEDGTGKVLTIHLVSTISQIKRAGLTVAKARRVSADEMDAIMNELNA